jgi:hypothetical protein
MATTARIRKVWLPGEMKEALREFCWRHRTKPSPFIVSIIEEVIESPHHFEDSDVPPAGQEHISVYVQDEVWFAGIEAAEPYGFPLSALIRVGIARELATEGIPWTTSTPRPRNDHIPIRE